MIETGEGELLTAGKCRALGEAGGPSTPHRLRGREGKKERRRKSRKEGEREREREREKKKERFMYYHIIPNAKFQHTITLLLVRTMALDMEMLEAPVTA